MTQKTTQAISAANVLSAAARAGHVAKTMWAELRRQAVRGDDTSLTFPDGSTVRFVSQSNAYLAM